MKKNNIINTYFKLISEFNTNNSKWKFSENFYGIEIYTNKDHILQRLSDKSRFSLASYNNIFYIKVLVKYYLRQHINNLQDLIKDRNPQGLFFAINILSLQTEINHYLYFTCDFQYNNIKQCYQISINTILPNIDMNGNPIIPYAAKTDKRIVFSF